MNQDDLLEKIPPEERALRRELGEAMMTFVQQLNGTIEVLPPQFPGKPAPLNYDEALREHYLENYRLVVEKAAAHGIEVSLCWRTLAYWTNDGPDRIDYFSRALACVESNRDADLRPKNAQTGWSDLHMKADCLFEIGRVHANEGDPRIARDFLLRALPLAREVEALRGPAGVMHDDRLEGRIAELLVQLPDDEDQPTK